ncbi:MAG: aldo/keto reductase [Agathobacter sp.]|uniref:aldo/keto reductase n=1 Tax=Agathobacter sp. TaxID=2021311 RepID=UPI00258759EB|nr:aldo/keto reductase [Agathobacter sp.]MCR5677508.1 aldo/keto reductase [Agathobacter sp.]
MGIQRNEKIIDQRRIVIPDTDLGALFPLGLGSMKAESAWDKQQTYRIFDTYFDRGGNLFDTARVYSLFSKSEEWIGDWLKETGKRNRIVLISKGGHPDLTAQPFPDMHRFRLSKEEMTSDLETSLRTLQTNHIDIYLYHRDDPARSVEELVDTMESFVQAGKIRYYGCSNWTLPRIEQAMNYAKAMGYRGFVMNQGLLNAASDDAGPLQDDTLIKIDPQMRAYHKAHPEILATAYSGIALGFFAQYLRGGADAVRDKSYLTDANIARAKQMEQSAKEKGITLLQETLGYFKTLEHDCIPLFTPRDEAGICEAMEA